MTLQQQLDSIRAELDRTVDPRVLAKLDRAIAQLRASDIRSRALGAGAQAPDFELANVQGKSLRLSHELARGPAVLVFVRGEWCPYCTATIRTWQSMHPIVREMGASFLMISPQSPEVSAGTRRRHRLTFDILGDPWARVAGEFGIAYEIAGEYRGVVQGEFGLDVGVYNGTLNWQVPVSATYVIDQDRRIEFAHVEPDHRVRLEPEETLVVLARLREFNATG